MYNYFIVSYFENRTMSRLVAQPVIELPNRNLERFALSSNCTALRIRIDYGEIVVELKAVIELVADHEAQLFNYMRIARQQVGYLLNFGKRGELQWKRFILSDLHTRAEEH